MSLNNHSQEELAKMAMIDLANLLMMEEKKALDFREAFDRVAEIKGFTEQEKEDQIAQFYTDLNVDGRFMTIGSNVWGLKRWYPAEQIDEEIAMAPTKKKRAAKKDKDEDFEDEDFDFEDEDGEADLDLAAGFDDEEEEEEEEEPVLKDKDFDDDDDDDEDEVFGDGFDIIDGDEEEE